MIGLINFPPFTNDEYAEVKLNRVVQYAVEQHRLYQKMGGTTDYTEEELVFAALFLDLGKLGDGEQPNYLPQTDKWRQDKLSEMYQYNPDLDFPKAHFS